MTMVTVTISKDSASSEILVLNILEDLRDDLKFFLNEAKSNKPGQSETMFLHQRFLRAALLALFAYAEAVANSWLHSLLKKGNMEFVFEKLQYIGLDKKIEVLQEAASASSKKPNLTDAKKMRNLFVHFTPGRENEAFEKLSLPLIESAAEELDRWMTDMESALELPRHDDSEAIMSAFVETGSITKSASSGVST
jgi:hypothetical protein